MKRFVFCVLFLLCCFSMVYSQKKEEQSIIEQREEIFKYGLESEIIDLLNTLIKDEDTLFNKDIFDLFQKTKNVTVKEKIIDYFTVIENPILKDYVLTILEDPYDEKKSTVTLLLKYTSKLKLQEADPLVLELLKSENEDYIDICIETLGEIGNVDSALFLAEYLKTEDLSVGRKQALMKALGKLNAVETWDALVEIVQNEEENSFVRMYAAEALGNMKKEESIPILEELYSSSDANLRQYVLKGLKNFDTPEALAIILDGFKDNFYKVRLESAAIAKDKKIPEAVPFLIYRCKKDSESAVKLACYDALGAIQDEESKKFLFSILEDKKLNENIRAKIVSVIMNNSIEEGYDLVRVTAEESLSDDKLKNLRYAIGKEIVKYPNPLFEKLCGLFLAHKDIATQGIGIDIFEKGNFLSLKDRVIEISENQKSGPNKRKAQLALEKIEKREK